MNLSRKMFRQLLLLYPSAYRAEFGGEMAELFELRLMASRSRVRFLISEFAGLIAGAVRERVMPRMEPLYVGTQDLDAAHLPKPVVAARLRVDSAMQKMVHAISHHQFEEARRLAIEERTERENLRRVCDMFGIDTI